MANDSQEGESVDNNDFISSLPDVLLHHILSFVPTYLAIRTCVLSKRWRQIWREVPSLFLECDEDSIDSVNKTLFNHTAEKLLSFHLGFRFDATWLVDFYEEGTSSHEFFIVDTWIDFALAYKPENLSLDLYLYHYKRYKIPDIFYVNPSVKRLSLTLQYTALIPTFTVFWPSLRTLCLDGCCTTDESAAKILSGCPLLESLTLNFCRLFRLLDLSNSMHLRRLEIDYRQPKNSGPAEIVAPHIHYLRLKLTSTPPCSLEDVSSLTEAKLNLLYFAGDTMADFLHVMDPKMLPKLHNIDKLTLGSMFLQVLSVAELHGVHFPVLKITTLILEADIINYFVPSNVKLLGVPGIAKLLQNSPELKKLTLNLEKSYYVEENQLVTYTDMRGIKFEVFPTSSEPKLIALFIELVLGHTKTPETLVVCLEDNLDAGRFEELFQMAQRLPHDHNNVSIVIKHNVLDFEFSYNLF